MARYGIKGLKTHILVPFMTILPLILLLRHRGVGSNLLGGMFVQVLGRYTTSYILRIVREYFQSYFLQIQQ